MWVSIWSPGRWRGSLWTFITPPLNRLDRWWPRSEALGKTTVTGMRTTAGLAAGKLLGVKEAWASFMGAVPQPDRRKRKVRQRTARLSIVKAWIKIWIFITNLTLLLMPL
jgi:hypothetical protein